MKGILAVSARPVSLVALLGWALLVGLASPTAAFAATSSPTPTAHSPQTPPTTSAHPSAAKPFRPLNYCFINTNPTSATVKSGQQFTIYVYWSNCDSSWVVVNVDWKDNTAPQEYTCWAACSSGNTSFTHTYNTIKTFYPEFWLSGNANSDHKTAAITVVQ